MTFVEILNFLNPTQLGNTIFYPLLTIFVSNCVALSLFVIDPKNRYVYLFISIPIGVSIICVSVNGLYQLGSILNTEKLTYSLRLFQMLVLLIGMLFLCGITTGFKVKYAFISYVIALILHACFYYYCSHYDAGIISRAFHPVFEYLVVLALANFFISHVTLPDHIKIFSVNTPFIDSLMPVNEKNSHQTIVLLLAYSMIIHTNVMVLMYSSTFDYWLSSVIVLCVVLLQCVIVIMCFRMMYIYPSSANTPFYVSAYLMIIKLLIDALYTNYKMFKENKPVNVQPQYFYNKFFYLFVFILVICLLDCDVAIAADEGPSSPVSESNMFYRISQSGLSQLLTYAIFYEGVSAFREWLQEQAGLGSEREEFLTAVEDCHNAKTNLENIPYKIPSEVLVINEAKYILKGNEIERANLSSEELQKYTERLGSYHYKNECAIRHICRL